MQFNKEMTSPDEFLSMEKVFFKHYKTQTSAGEKIPQINHVDITDQIRYAGFILLVSALDYTGDFFSLKTWEGTSKK